MITLTCDNCEKPFQIEDDAAGEKVACPYCGDINRVPPAPGSPPAGSPVAALGGASDRPAAAERPTGVAAPGESGRESRHEVPEQNITVVRAAMFRAHPFWYSLMVLIGVGGIVLAVLASTSADFVDTRWLMWVGVGGLAVACLWWLIWWAAPHRWVKLVITSKRTIRQEGIVVRKTSEVLHNHIRNVKIEQSFIDRLLGVGTIAIDSAGGSEEEPIEIEMRHIPDPYGVKKIIDRYRRM